MPGDDFLLGSGWPSVVLTIDVATWDLCLGVALLLAATVFARTGPGARVRRSLQISASLCILGCVGAVAGSTGLRDVGILGYAVVLPVVLLLVRRVFATTPSWDPAG